MKEHGSGLPRNIEVINQRQSAATLPDSQIVFGRSAVAVFMPESTNGKNIVRIPKAVVEEGIKKWDQCLVGQFLGQSADISTATASMSTIAFAKVCVEISIEDKIMEDISVMDDDGEELLVRVEYLWMPEKCIACREFGHSISTCTRFKNLIGKSDYFL
ncbi:hypothetical protein GH714_014527 [Hevea brasiliensis]|uniref:DUF4283 domain-containing protein n=1 Tax=Hevea brasiliensis TaxID=3981 RepID=A0A6A6LJ88_HEVBR|nr:hypothetical protein GH714_014527 [Hevea brasiliensis]